MTPRYPQQPYVKAPLYNPVFSWTGFYLGLNGGGGWGHSTWDRAGELRSVGWRDRRHRRLQLADRPDGVRHRRRCRLVGHERDDSAFCPAGCSVKNDWLGTVRGRLGYSFDRFLPYFTGGLAAGNIQATAPGFAGATQTNLGWTVGAGIEVAIVGNWSAKAEYLHVDLGSFNCGLACGPFTPDNVSLKEDLVRGGVNYKF